MSNTDNWHLPLLVLDFALNGLDGVRGLHLEGDGLTREASEWQIAISTSARTNLSYRTTHVFTKICILLDIGLSENSAGSSQ